MDYYIKRIGLGLVVLATSYFVLLQVVESRVEKKEKETFLFNIKHGIHKQIADNKLFDPKKMYNFEAFRAKKAIEVSTQKEAKLSEVITKENVFINFWFKGCIGCEKEMPEIEKFYEKYKNQIQFIVISNDDVETVRNYVTKNNYNLPFYVFKDDNFPIGINIFPTSHLITNKKTRFFYAGIGYFNNPEFYNYVDSVLVK